MNKRILITTMGLGSIALVAVVGVQAYEAHQPAGQTEEAQAMAPADTWQDPWVEFHRQMRAMQANMDRMFSEAFQGPAVSGPVLPGPAVGQVTMDDQGDHYTISVNLPAASAEDIQVDLEGQQLNIRANTSVNSERKDGNGHVVEQRSYSNAYQQMLSLPGKVKSDAVQTHFDDGVLTVTIPKV